MCSLREGRQNSSTCRVDFVLEVVRVSRTEVCNVLSKQCVRWLPAVLLGTLLPHVQRHTLTMYDVKCFAATPWCCGFERASVSPSANTCQGPARTAHFTSYRALPQSAVRKHALSLLRLCWSGLRTVDMLSPPNTKPGAAGAYATLV